MHDAAFYIQLLLSGVTVGSLYALIAIGYTMVYGILRLINFAHGDIFMMAGFFMVYISASCSLAVSIPLVLLLTDLVTHFLLCIMNTTVIHGGRFVYERPLLLLAVYMLQVALVIIMAYGGNDLYFKVNKPQRCLMVARRGECIEDLIKKVGRYKKQYNTYP